LDDNLEQQPSSKKKKPNIVVKIFKCPHCKKIYKINAFLENHIRNKHRDAVPPTFQQFVLKQFENVQGQFVGVYNELGFKARVESAKLEEKQDAIINEKRKNTMVISGLLGFTVEGKYPNTWKCDSDKLMNLFKSIVPEKLEMRANIINSDDKNSPFRVRFENSDMASSVKKNLQTITDIRIDMSVTLATRIRKMILSKLVDHLVATGLPVEFEPDHDHQPKIKVMWRGYKEFKEYGFAEAVNFFQQLFDLDTVNPKLDESIMQQARRMPPGTNVQDIFIVL